MKGNRKRSRMGQGTPSDYDVDPIPEKDRGKRQDQVEVASDYDAGRIKALMKQPVTEQR